MASLWSHDFTFSLRLPYLSTFWDSLFLDRFGINLAQERIIGPDFKQYFTSEANVKPRLAIFCNFASEEAVDTS